MLYCIMVYMRYTSLLWVISHDYVIIGLHDSQVIMK